MPSKISLRTVVLLMFMLFSLTAATQAVPVTETQPATSTSTGGVTTIQAEHWWNKTATVYVTWLLVIICYCMGAGLFIRCMVRRAERIGRERGEEFEMTPVGSGGP